MWRPLGAYLAFTVGPICGVNRTSSEPPSHRDCAEFAVRACPFLTQRELERRTSGLPDAITKAPGLAIAHNPGVVMLWITRSYRPWQVPEEAVDGYGAQPGVLFEMGEPLVIECYRQGRPATQVEIAAAIAQGVPYLQATAEREGPRAMAELWQALQAFEQLLAAYVA